jgi:malonyl-CoA O-methyltransferase
MRLSGRKSQIAAKFGAGSTFYDGNADLQSRVAGALAGYLPDLARPAVLEVGAGTGFLSAHILRLYPQGDLLITDLSAEMIEACRAKFPSAKAHFAVMDGEKPALSGKRFDLIASSMAFQWFGNPREDILKLRDYLKPGGRIYYAAPGPDNFREWEESLAQSGLKSGFDNEQNWPGVIAEKTEIVSYGNALSFLRVLRTIGADVPKLHYIPQGPSLRRACRILDKCFAGKLTWHIVYGCVRLD